MSNGVGFIVVDAENTVFIHLYKYSYSVLIIFMSTEPTPSYALTDLCILADLPPRTVRYYVQIGLVDRPEGETRAARYGAVQLEQLLLIKKWTAAGLSLDRIRELLHGEQVSIPLRARAIGSVEVRSHLMVADGVDIVIEPKRAGLSPEQMREFIKGVMAVFTQVSNRSGMVSVAETKTRNEKKEQ